MQLGTLIRAVVPVALLTAACAPGATTEGPAGGPMAAFGTPEMVAQGAQLYQGNGRCAVCHGPGGAGGRLGPSLQDDNWIWTDPASDSFHEDLVRIIRDGISEPRQARAPMPPMGGGQLSEEEIVAIASYVASL